MNMKRTMSWIAAVALVTTAGAASAFPVTYTFQSGSLRVEASSGATVHGLSDLAVLDASSSITIDTDAGTLNNLFLKAANDVDISLTPAYLGLASLTLEDLTLSGTGGTLSSLGGTAYSYALNPLDFSAVVSGNPINASTNSTGFVFLDTMNFALLLQGVTIGQFTPQDLGLVGNDNLVLKADLLFVGEGVIPEPNSAYLMGIGVVLVAGAGMARRRKA